jgi:hypothetical protein
MEPAEERVRENKVIIGTYGQVGQRAGWIFYRESGSHQITCFYNPILVYSNVQWMGTW